MSTLASTLSCHTDTQCSWLNHCNSNNECVHKDLWPPGIIEIITYAIFPIFIGIASVGGLGKKNCNKNY